MQDNDSCSNKSKLPSRRTKTNYLFQLSLISRYRVILGLYCRWHSYRENCKTVCFNTISPGVFRCQPPNQKTSPPSFCLCISVSSSRSILQAVRLCRMAADDRSSDILKMAASVVWNEAKRHKTPADKCPISQLTQCISAYVPTDMQLSWQSLCYHVFTVYLYIGGKKKFHPSEKH